MTSAPEQFLIESLLCDSSAIGARSAPAELGSGVACDHPTGAVLPGVQVRDDQGNVVSDAPGAPPLYPVSFRTSSVWRASEGEPGGVSPHREAQAPGGGCPLHVACGARSP